MRTKNTIIGIISMTLVIGMLASVMAVGVTGYSAPVIVKPGESIDLAWRLQNMVGEDSYVVTTTTTASDEINLTLLDESNLYELAEKTEGVRVNFRVTIPEDIEIGTEYVISGSFIFSPKTEEGTLGIGSGIDDTFKITVGDETDDTNVITPPRIEAKKTSNLLPIILILLVLILGIIGYVHHRRHMHEVEN